MGCRAFYKYLIWILKKPVYITSISNITKNDFSFQAYEEEGNFF